MAGSLKKTNKAKKTKGAGSRKKLPALFLFYTALAAGFLYAAMFFMNPKIINPSLVNASELRDKGDARKYKGINIKRFEYKESEVIGAFAPGKKAYHETVSVPWEMIIYDYAKNAGGYVTYRKDESQGNTIIFSLHVTHGKRADAES